MYQHTLREEASAGLQASTHYMVPVEANTTGTERWHWDRIQAAINAQALPSYDTFWGDHHFCRHVVSGLYRADLQMYVRMCSTVNHLLRPCAAMVQTTCDAQLRRLREVCVRCADPRLGSELVTSLLATLWLTLPRKLLPRIAQYGDYEAPRVSELLERWFAWARKDLPKWLRFPGWPHRARLEFRRWLADGEEGVVAVHKHDVPHAKDQ